MTTKEDRSWNGRDEEVLEITELTHSIASSQTAVTSNGGTSAQAPSSDIGYYVFPDEEREWRQHALCRGLDSNLFFPERGHSMLPAYSICRGCSVRMECLEFAISSGDKWGIRGGFTPDERKKIKGRVNKEGVSYETASEPFDQRRYKRLLRAIARVGAEGIRALHREAG